MKKFKDLFLSLNHTIDTGFLDAYLEHISTAPLLPPTSYTERHHILPVCLFPEFKDFRYNAWNEKRLKPEDHFIAHYLLYKAFPGSSKLAWAWKCMWRGSKIRGLTSTLLFQYATEYAILMKQGLKHTLESRKKSSESHRGKKASEETKRKISVGGKGKKKPEGFGAKVAAANKARVFTDEMREAISSRQIGRKASEETRAKMRASSKRLGRPGTKHSEETKRKISEKSKRPRKPMSAEAKQKQQETWAKKREIKLQTDGRIQT